MRYVVYVDIFFVVNLIMNYIILFFAKSFIKPDTTSLRCFLGGLGGAIASCIMIYPGIDNILLDFCIKYVGIVVLMNYIAFRIKNIVGNIKAMITTYAITFILGGIMNLLYYHTYAGVVVWKIINGFRYGRLSITKCIGITLIAYGCIYAVMQVLFKEKKQIKKNYQVIVGVAGKEVILKGLYDSGNMLKEPIEGKPVHIVSNTVKQLLQSDVNRNIRVIPYNSVGGTGILYSVLVEYMKVYDEFGNIIYEKKDERIAFSDREVSLSKEFEILLNRSILEMEQ